MYKKTILIIMCLFLFPSVFAFLPTEGLVASYDLNDNNFNGEVNDSGVTDYLGVNNGTYFGRTFNHGTNTGATYNNVTGTITGATWLDEGDCVRGTCLEFDGDGDYTESSLPLIKADITLSAWVKTNNNVDTQFIINKRSPSDARSHYGLRLSNGNNPEFYLTSDATDIQTGLYVSDPLEDNKWHLITATYNNVDMKIYTNGVLAQTKSFPNIYPYSLNNRNGYIGRRGWGSFEQYFNGSIDEVQIFSKALNQTEITELYEDGYLSHPTPAEKSFRMDEGTGTNTYSSSQMGTALEFDGVNDRVTIPPISSISNGTICAWAKLNSVTSASYLFDARETAGVGYCYFNPTPSLICNGGTHYVNAINTQLAIFGSWALYCNSGIPIDASTSFKIGSASNNGNVHNGTIDEVKIWDRALTQEEIQEEMNANAPVNIETQYTGVEYTLLEDFEVDDFILTGVTRVHSLDTDSTENTYSLNINKTGIIWDWVRAYKTISSIDLSDYERICIDIKTDDYNEVDNLNIWLGNTVQWTTGIDFNFISLESNNDWNTYCMDFDDKRTHGTPDLTNITELGFEFKKLNNFTALGHIYLDNLRLVSTDEPTGLVAYYDFNEESGTTTYDNNQLSTGYLQVTPQDRAMTFDGVDDYITTTETGDYNMDTYTFSFWLKSSGLSSYGAIFSDNINEGRIQVFGSSLLVNDLGTSSLDLVVLDVVNTNWTHYIIKYNGTQLSAYTDSILRNSISAIEPTLVINKNFRIGSYKSNSNYLNGSIKDVRIYNRSLTENEIKILYDEKTEENRTYNLFTSNIPSTNVSEGDIVIFSSDSNVTSNVKWFLDGALQYIGNIWTWFVGVHDADEDHEIIAYAENETHAEYQIFETTVLDKFPLIPYSISPQQGIYDDLMKISCRINDTFSWFRNSTYDYQIYYDAEWHNLTINHSKAIYSAYILHIDDQENVQVRCRSNDGIFYSDWSDIATNLTISHEDFKLRVYDDTNTRKKTIYTPLLYNVYCKYPDDDDKYRIKNLYADCSGDGVWDWAKTYNDDQYIDNDYMSFECRFNKPGIYEMSAGCVIEKLNTTADWDLAKCLRLEKDDKYCLRANSFSEIINEGWA